jgi:hypothetical protein
MRTRLNFPDDFQLLAQPVVLNDDSVTACWGSLSAIERPSSNADLATSTTT